MEEKGDCLLYRGQHKLSSGAGKGACCHISGAENASFVSFSPLKTFFLSKPDPIHLSIGSSAQDRGSFLGSNL